MEILKKNENEMFSEKLCGCIIKVHKKFIKKIKVGILYLEISTSVANGIIPSSAIGLIIR